MFLYEMKQPIRKNIKTNKKKEEKPKVKKQSTKPLLSKKKQIQYGTSKLERYFANEFLDKYGIKYIYEYEARDIKRFYDFAIVTKKANYITEEKEGLNSIIQGIQHTPIDFIIEIDGSYFHADPRVVSEEKRNAMHKRNQMVDELKNRWCELHGIPLLRIWEYDIKNNPKKVLDEMRKFVHIPDIVEKKRKRVMKLK